MRRALVLVLTALAGAVAGAAGAAALRHDEPVVLPPTRGAVVTHEDVPTPREGMLLVWTPGGLPAGFADRVRDVVGGATSVVRGDTIWLRASADAEGRPVDDLADGYAIPLDAVAFECESWAPLVPLAEAGAVCNLAEGEVLLGATSARLRRLGAGATLTLEGGRVVRVAGVVADEVVGAAEVVLPAADAAAAGVRTERYVLARFAGDRARIESAIVAAAGDGAGGEARVRVRGPGETPWLRHGDAVLPPALLKEQFGEWSARRLGDGRLLLDPAWEAANLGSDELPGLGRTRCHRDLMPVLRAALEELQDRGLLPALDRAAAGCWNPRTIAGTNRPSAHAWGAAIDLAPFTSDPAAVEILERSGLTWGGRWLDPDPVHFEFVRTAKPR